jgi:hypothetical protein
MAAGMQDVILSAVDPVLVPDNWSISARLSADFAALDRRPLIDTSHGRGEHE